MKIEKYVDSYIFGVEKERNFIGVDGWFFATDGSKCTPHVFINNVEYTNVVFKKKGRPDVNDHYAGKCTIEANPGFEAKIYLDKDITAAAAKSFRIEIEASGKRVVLLKLNKSEFKEKLLKYVDNTQNIVCFIDEKRIGKQYITLAGWAVNAKSGAAIDVALYDGRNKRVNTAEITRNKRRDVFNMYNGSCDPVSGFIIKFKYNLLKRYVIVLTCGDERMHVKIDVIKMFLRKLKNYRIKKRQMTYQDWIKRNHTTKKELLQQREHKFSYNPLISIVIPLYETDHKLFCELIDSVIGQTYKNFELCLADGSKTDELKGVIETNYPGENRIKYKKLEDNLHISGNTNEAIKMSSGEYIMFADHDDLLSPDALYEMVGALNADRTIDAIYSDEDKTDFKTKNYFEPHFKPDFSIDLLRSNNYICHLFMVRRELADKVSDKEVYLRTEYNGAQDYDFVLRCCEKAEKIHHVPKVLYHWRCHEKSTAANPASKMYAFEAGKRAIEAHYERVGIDADVEHTKNLGIYRSRFKVRENPLVSIIIPNKDHIEDLDKCIKSISEKSTYKNYEIIIVENNSLWKETFEYYRQLEAENDRCKVIYWKDEFNFSAINNFGAKEAKGEYLLLLNNDTEIITPEWIEELLGYCQREDVGAVGARLYYHDDTIQHAGVILGFGGIAGHAGNGLYRYDPGYMARPWTPQDMSIVTAACMMVDRKVFDEAGGLDERLKVAFNDVDFCLKIRKLGYLVVYNPYVELYHYESKSRGMEDTPEKAQRFAGEIDVIKDKWESELKKGDPYYNPNLSLKRADYSLRGEDEKLEG